LVEVLNNVLDKVHPDLVSLYNGRFYETRPIFEFARILGYNVRCYENIKTADFTNRNRVFFENTLPQNVKKTGELINETWKSAKLSERERRDIGQSFFINRSNAIFAGDTIYTKNQRQGLLPRGWDESRRNIVIFISSEDEFFAIDDEFDKKMFDSQYEGIIQILQNFKKESVFHFYLRIHPNLKNVKYKYHLQLIRLEEFYTNVTVIQADSEISTYALLYNTEKSIVFGSTMGIEACFWQKPVILLGSASYQDLDVCYRPLTLESAISLIKEIDLRVKDKKNALKYGFFFMYDGRGEKPLYFDFNLKFKHFKLINKKIILLNFKPVKYSLFILFLTRCFLRVLEKLSLYTAIKIPLDED
jgi:hypothetical protein